MERHSGDGAAKQHTGRTEKAAGRHRPRVRQPRGPLALRRAQELALPATSSWRALGVRALASGIVLGICAIRS